MKKIDVSALTGTRGAPFLKETFVHTDSQVQEVVDALVKGLIGTYTAGDLIILHGCVITGTTTKAITSGAIYYDGEVYIVDAASGLTAGANTWIFDIVTTYESGDPVTYDDGSTHNQHQIDKIAFQVGASGSGIADWDNTTVKTVQEIQEGVWVDGTSLLSSGWTVAPANVFQYKVDIYGNVTFRGVIKSPSSGTTFQWIVGNPFAPQNSLQYVSCGTAATGNVYVIVVNSNGNISVSSASGGTAFIGNNKEFVVNLQWRLDE